MHCILHCVGNICINWRGKIPEWLTYIFHNDKTLYSNFVCMFGFFSVTICVWIYMKDVLQHLSFLTLQNNQFPGPGLGEKPWCSKREVTIGCLQWVFMEQACHHCIDTSFVWMLSSWCGESPFLPSQGQRESPAESNFSSAVVTQKLYSGSFLRADVIEKPNCLGIRVWCALAFS